MKNGLPISDTDFLCAVCGRWHDTAETAGLAPGAVSAGGSPILAVGRVLSGYSRSRQPRYICRSCRERKQRRSRLYLAILATVVTGGLMALLVFWLGT